MSSKLKHESFLLQEHTQCRWCAQFHWLERQSKPTPREQKTFVQPFQKEDEKCSNSHMKSQIRDALQGSSGTKTCLATINSWKAHVGGVTSPTRHNCNQVIGIGPGTTKSDTMQPLFIPIYIHFRKWNWLWPAMMQDKVQDGRRLTGIWAWDTVPVCTVVYTAVDSLGL